MNLTRVTRSAARGVTIVLMGAAVVTATADGFVQSYAGLLSWAHEHQVQGWKADSFPLLVDLFVLIGEMGLFLLAIDGHKLTRRALSWVDLAIPAATAGAGWAVSLFFNIGQVKGGRFSDRLTAGVPPIAAMVGLVILLRTMHRYVAAAETTGSEVVERVPDDHPAEMPEPVVVEEPTTTLATAPGTVERPPLTMTPFGGLSVAAAVPNDRPDQVVVSVPDDQPAEVPDDRPEPAPTTTEDQRPATTRKTKRPARKGRPTPEENAEAVAAYRHSVRDKRPLSERSLAEAFGRSKGWARDRIQEAGPLLVGGHPVDRPAEAANDQSDDDETTAGEATG